MRHSKAAILMLAILPLSIAIFANPGNERKAEPAIQGFVLDAATKKPVKGVTIYIKSAKLVREIRSDAEGNFRIPSLPCGEVTITLEKKGYKTYRREGVILKNGDTIRLNFDMWTEEMMDENEAFHPLLRMIH